MIKRLRVTVEGKAYDVQVEILAEEGAPAAHAYAPQPAPAAPAPVAGYTPSAPAPSAPAPAPKAPVAAAEGDLPSPLAGKVVEIRAKVGEAVSAGQVVAVLEAMKMNTNITAPGDGTIKAIHVAPGDAVEEGAPLLTLG